MTIGTILALLGTLGALTPEQIAGTTGLVGVLMNGFLLVKAWLDGRMKAEADDGAA